VTFGTAFFQASEANEPDCTGKTNCAERIRPHRMNLWRREKQPRRMNPQRKIPQDAPSIQNYFHIVFINMLKDNNADTIIFLEFKRFKVFRYFALNLHQNYTIIKNRPHFMASL